MSLDANLLAILACPEDKGPLYYVEAEQVLFNPRLGRTYDVRDGIPVMLVEEANDLDAAEIDRLKAVVVAGSIRPSFSEGRDSTT